MPERTTDPNLAAINDLGDSFNRFQATVYDKIDDLEARFQKQGMGPGAAGAAGGGKGQAAGRFCAQLRALGRYDGPDSVQLYDDYSRGLAMYLRVGQAGLPGDVQNALSVGSDPDGGYLVMPDVSERIVQRTFEGSPIRQIASVEQTGSEALVGIQDTEDMGGGWVAEQGDRSETDAGAFGEWRIPVHEVYALPIITNKMIDDARFDIIGYVERKAGDKFARLEGAANVTGNGVGKPRGFMNYAGDATTDDDDDRSWGVLQYVATGASAGFPQVSGSTADDAGPLYDLVAKLKPIYRANARWVMNRATANFVRKLRDAEGRFLWRDGLEPGQPDMLLGYPVTLAEDVVDIAANSFSIAFGDFRAGYVIADRAPMRIVRDNVTTKGKTKLYLWRRVGGDLVDFDAIKLLKFGTS